MNNLNSHICLFINKKLKLKHVLFLWKVDINHLHLHINTCKFYIPYGNEKLGMDSVVRKNYHFNFQFSIIYLDPLPPCHDYYNYIKI